jgi:hypothetical protein
MIFGWLLALLLTVIYTPIPPPPSAAEKKEEPTPTPTSVYETKYLEHVRSMKVHEKNDDDIDISHRFVIEYTPLGNVLMKYDTKNESFVYYSDVTIPYAYLEVVARKYVKVYDCRHLYVSSVEELEPSPPPPPPATSLPVKRPSGPKHVQSSLRPNSKPSEVEIVKNRYTYLGRMRNHSFLENPRNKSAIVVGGPMSYAYFKKRHIGLEFGDDLAMGGAPLVNMFDSAEQQNNIKALHDVLVLEEAEDAEDAEDAEEAEAEELEPEDADAFSYSDYRKLQLTRD